VVTRRALLGAGAGALLLAGCGPPKATATSRTDVLDEQLRLTLVSVAAGSSRARARAKTLQAAGATAKAPASTSLSAYEAERNALAGYVQAVGQLRDADSRRLLGGLVVDAAESEAQLAHDAGQNPLATAFPGQPS
jgi:hypothetical protein